MGRRGTSRAGDTSIDPAGAGEIGTVRSPTSRPFEKPRSGRVAVKAIKHLSDEVRKVFRVGRVIRNYCGDRV
jgi:hypothetical protein